MRLTEKTFKNGMYSLGLIFDRDVTDPELNSLYWLTLYEYPDEAVKNAFSRVLSTCKWFPKPADLIEAIEVSRKSMGKLAWAEVKGMLNTWGGMWNHIWKTDGATAEAVKSIGGWSHLSGLRAYDLGQLEDAFIGAYDRAVASGALYTLGEVVGKRDRNWETGEFKDLTVIEGGEKTAITIKAGACKVIADDGPLLSPEGIAVLPSETEQRMADLMIAKKLN